jgi:acyl dehydratase
MNDQSLVTPAIRATLGIESKPYVFEVEKGDIVRYAAAIGETNPRYADEAAARKGRLGGIVAPPTYLIVMRILEVAAFRDIRPDVQLTRSLDGGSEWRYFEPIRPGDRITATKKLVDAYERAGSLGRMLFLVSEITYLNQFDEVVVVQRDTAIYY